MRQHLIPEDGRPHTPTGECGCGASVDVTRSWPGEVVRVDVLHTPPSWPWPGTWVSVIELEVDD